MGAETLLKTDKVNLSAEALKDGKIVLRTTSWDQNKVILADQICELRFRDGQVHVIRAEAGAPAAAALMLDEKALDAMARRMLDDASLTGNLEIGSLKEARHIVTDLLELAASQRDGVTAVIETE